MNAVEQQLILVVEDDPAIARLILVFLREAGWPAIHAATGMQALLLWAEHDPALVLLDVMLPDLSGWDLCTALRAESMVPIIMLTAKAADEDVVHGLNLGADDYLAKPFTQAQLLARINAVTRRAVVSSPPSPPASDEESAAEAGTSTPPLPLEDVPGCALLRDARQHQGLTLYQVERRTGLRWDYLQALERGAFMTIPLSDMRATMLKYCAFLGVDARPVFLQAQQAYATHSQQRQFNRVLMAGLAATIVILALLPFMLRLI